MEAAVSHRQPSILHVGFTNTGTTSLQQNFFSQRDDIFYVGYPYGERGGIFTLLRHAEDFKYDEQFIFNLCDEQIFNNSSGRNIVISDEMLCNSPQLYYAPYMVPRDIIAARLFRLFQPARVVFTIRNQAEYVSSMYLNLKRNSAFFSRMPMPPLAQWYQGMLSQFRCHFLHNLNFSEVIDVYGQLFGYDNILVLPLEKLINDGIEEYLGALCNFIGIELARADIERYGEARNTRMSAMKSLAAEMMPDDGFFNFYSTLQQRLGSEQLDELLDAGDRAEAMLDRDDVADLRLRVAAGNRLLAERYSLDLERYGYPLGQGHASAASGAPVRSRMPRAPSSNSTNQLDQLQAIIDTQRTANARLVDELNERFSAEREAFVARIRELETQPGRLPQLVRGRNARLRSWFNPARSLGMTRRTTTE